MPESSTSPRPRRAAPAALAIVLLGLIGTATPAGRLLPPSMGWLAPALWAVGVVMSGGVCVLGLVRPTRGRLRPLAVLALAIGSFPLSAMLTSAMVGERRELRVDGRARRYHVETPDRSAARPWPVVVALHGLGQTWWGIREISRLDRLASQGRALVVYPEGYLRSWNDGDDLKPATRAGVDDLGLLRALLDDLARRYPVDPDRLYAVGFSNGGFLLVRRACQLADRLAAIGVVAAGAYPVWADECRGRPLPPAAFVLGEQDPMLRGLEERFEVSPSASERLWGPVVDARARRVALWSLPGHGHGWPGGPQFLPAALIGPVRQDWPATDSLVAFLFQHRRLQAKELP